MTANERQERAGSLDESHPATRVEEDHRTLREQLEIISAAKTRSELLAGVLHMPKTLREHFDLEEQVGGLYDDLTSRSPASFRELEALRGEHRVILKAFEALCRQLKRLIEDEGSIEEISERLTGDVGHCLKRLRDHEREESRVITDVYYTDEGGLG